MAKVAMKNFLRLLLGGAFAGLVAGLVLGFYLIFVGLPDSDPWLVARLAGVGLFGDAVFSNAPGAILVSLLIHLGVSMGWGVLFAAVIHGEPKGLTFFAAIAWAFVAWAVMSYAIGPAMAAGPMIQGIPIGRMITGHALFGVALGLAFVPFQRRDQSPGRIRRPVHA
ncbi:hypothetical protein [Vulgatibacter incomptus]|uniref:DUF1440 domain-containing protein n=1 Tax=Vulgatibacter incomptus TaxID=1391653 RepID=A0A0K1P9T1_9BACT|nr:hypothetical protein [Vulgatibacter incomptus]AKU90191.1 hypothetical protein AKJ08_0578 [Vulgatibacter incomptus]